MKRPPRPKKVITNSAASRHNAPAPVHDLDYGRHAHDGGRGGGGAGRRGHRGSLLVKPEEEPDSEPPPNPTYDPSRPLPRNRPLVVPRNLGPGRAPRSDGVLPMLVPDREVARRPIPSRSTEDLVVGVNGWDGKRYTPVSDGNEGQWRDMVVGRQMVRFRPVHGISRQWNLLHRTEGFASLLIIPFQSFSAHWFAARWR